MTLVTKPWGTEEWWADVPGSYLGKVLRIDPGRRLSLHYHVEKIESMRVIGGYGRAWVGQTVDELHEHQLVPGSYFDVPAGYPHRIECTGADELVVVEVSTYHPDDVVRIEDDFDRVTRSDDQD